MSRLQPHSPATVSRRRVIAVWWLACLLWSAGWLFIKVGLADLPPLTFAAMRLALALLVLAPLVVLRGEWTRPTARDMRTVAVSGLLLLGVNYALVYWGAQFLPSALTSVLQATTPVFGFIIGIAVGAERFTITRALAIALGFAGVAIVSRGQLEAGPLAAAGSIAVVIGAACVASSYAIVKRRGTHMPPALLSAGQTLCGLIPLGIAGVMLEGNPAAIQWTAPAVAALLYLALASSVLAFWLNYWLLRHIDATAVLSMMLVQPLIAAVLGAVVLGETFGLHAAVGGACILAGATVILRHR